MKGRAAAGLALALLAAGPAAAHDPFGLGSPTLAGAMNPASFPFQGAAATALAAVVAARPTRGARRRALGLLVAALVLGPLLLLALRWGPTPWGPTTAAAAMLAGLAAALPPLRREAPVIAALIVGGLTVGMASDLHAPWDVAARMAAGASMSLAALAALIVAALSSLPDGVRRVAAGVLGAWCAAAGTMGLAFAYAA